MPTKLKIGANPMIDENVILGYAPGRKIPDTALRIGDNACVRTGSVIYGGTSIGKDFECGHNVTIREENRIGDGVAVWSNSVIDYGCVLGDRVKVHCNVYIAQFTVLEDDVFFAPGVSIANDPHPLCGDCMRGPTIKRGARLGVNVTVLPFVTIGENYLIGAGAVVTKDIPPGSVVVGNPGRVTGSVYELPCRHGDKGMAYQK